MDRCRFRFFTVRENLGGEVRRGIQYSPLSLRLGFLRGGFGLRLESIWLRRFMRFSELSAKRELSVGISSLSPILALLRSQRFFRRCVGSERCRPTVAEKRGLRGDLSQEFSAT